MHFDNLFDRCRAFYYAFNSLSKHLFSALPSGTRDTEVNKAISSPVIQPHGVVSWHQSRF